MAFSPSLIGEVDLPAFLACTNDLTIISPIEKDGSTIVGQTAYSLLSYSQFMSDAFKTKTKNLHDHYYPLEYDPAIKHDEKFRLMDEWWAKSTGALVEERPTLETLYEAVSYAKLSLRPGFATVAQMSYQYNIPLIVFSAGLTQVIKEVLLQKGPTPLLLPNVHVVANDLCTEGDVVVDFKRPLIHSLNKKDTSIKMVRDHTQSWFEPMRTRKNVLLLGDNLGDAEMSDGYEGDPDVCIIKVGFLNSNVDGYLEAYKKAFDIVVLHDGPMMPVSRFLAEVIGHTMPETEYELVPE